MKTQLGLPCCLGPGISKDNIRFSIFIHNHGGRLYVTSVMGQQLYVDLGLVKGLNPSVASPNLKFLGSEAKLGHFLSIFLQAKESTGCRNFPSSLLFISCHLNCYDDS